LAGTGIRRNSKESGVKTGIPVPQEFLRSRRNSCEKSYVGIQKIIICDPLQNHFPVKNLSGKHRKKRNPQESFILLNPQNRFLSNRKYQPSRM
jgi:hypothetical protein